VTVRDAEAARLGFLKVYFSFLSGSDSRQTFWNLREKIRVLKTIPVPLGDLGVSPFVNSL
jgi:hypothetical protein